jgi:protein TonB
MSGWRWSRVGVLAISALVACGKRASPPPSERAADTPPPPSPPPPDQEPPVALNGDSPIQYPPRLFDRKVEGEVVLRLFVDSGGRLVPESSRVAQSSGSPALDSAALAGARKLRFAPARRRGIPVATTFLQPIEFRHPQSDATRGSPDAIPR